jgi:hypothetical protein
MKIKKLSIGLIMRVFFMVFMIGPFSCIDKPMVHCFVNYFNKKWNNRFL